MVFRKSVIWVLIVAGLAWAALNYPGEIRRVWRDVQDRIVKKSVPSGPGEPGRRPKAAGPASPPPGGGGMGAQAASVEAVPVTVKDLEETIEATGSLQSNEGIVLRPEIAGRVAEIFFEEGRHVEQGQPLVRLDDEVYRAELAEAEANLALSKTSYRRMKELADEGIVARQSYDEALSRLNADQAKLDLARAKLAKTQIAAPFSGFLGLRKIALGDYVNPGQDLVNLENTDPIKVEFRVAEVHLADLRLEQKIRVVVDAFPNRVFAGAIYAIDPRVDDSGRSIFIRAAVPNEKGTLKPGLFARVSIVVGRRAKAILVPEQAIIPQGTALFVFRAADGVARISEVKTGLRQNGFVEITQGLSKKDTVVVAGQMKIGDGTPIATLPDKDPGGKG